jgi:hypothetical protein
MLSLLSEQSSDLLAPRRQGKQFDDAVFKAAAKIPLEWKSMNQGSRGTASLIWRSFFSGHTPKNKTAKEEQGEGSHYAVG